MKKFIQSKINHTENIPNQAAETTAPTPAEKNSHIPPANVQPPLPLVPPPPDIPWTPLKVKEEVEDDEYKEEFKNETKEETTEQVDIKPPIEICRDFIRGECKRIGPCRYAHEYELSQLVGIFTFCRKFQTKGCTLPNCRYVHADVFEEQRFYRTGYLPPRAFTHQKKVPDVTHTTTSTSVTMTSMIQNLAPPPPPPPPPELEQHQSQNLPELVFSKPPPTLSDSLLMDYAAMHSSDPILDMVQSNSLKHSWNALDQSGLFDSEFGPSYPKKCKNCDILEFCLQHRRSELKKIIVTSEAMNLKIDQLDSKISKLNDIIMKVVRTNQPSFLSSTPDLEYGRDSLSLDKFAALWNL